MYNLEIMKLTIREDFRSGTVYSRFPVIKSHYLKTNMKLNYVYFEDAVTYFDKIVMFSHMERQIDILTFI